MAGAKRDYYEVLGVSKDASADQIKSAYRKLAMKWHPDRNPDNEEAKAKFQEASEAYEVLGNAEKRQRYDQFGHEGVNFGPGGFDFGRDFSHGADFSDIFETLFGGGGPFGGAFGGMFGSRRARRADPNAPQDGADMKLEMNIEFDEAVFGSERTFELDVPDQCSECGGTGAAKGTKRTTCPTCRGSGQVVQGAGFFQVRQPCPRCGGSGSVVEKPCPKCRGEGFATVKRKVTVRIPKGVDTGSRLRLSGKGGGGLRGGQPGDLYVHLRVRESDLFSREDAHLFVDVPVSVALAAAGGEVEVPTPDGMAKLKIAPGTANGRTFRLPRKGVPDVRGGVPGDLFARMVVETPAELNAKQKKLLEEFAKSLGKENLPEAERFAKRSKEFMEHRDAVRRRG